MNNQQHYKSNFLPVINSLPLSQNERMLYSQLYGVNYPIQQPFPQQQQIYNPYINSLNYGYQSSFIPAYTNNPQLKLPLIQSQIIDPLPINYNLGLMVHQPGSQIRLGFDLSDFGIPNEPPKQKLIMKKPKLQPVYQQPQFDYFEEAEVPKIYLSNEQQYRIIKGKMNNAQNYSNQMNEYRTSDRQYEQYQNQNINNNMRSEVPLQNQINQDQSQGSSNMELQESKEEKKKKKRRLAPRVKNEKKRQFGDYNKPSIKKLKRSIRILKIMLDYIDLYVKALENRIEEKKILGQKRFEQNQVDGTEMLLDWIDDITHDFLIELLNTTDTLIFQIGQDKQNTSVKKKIGQLFQFIQIKIGKEFKPAEIIKGPLAIVLNNLIQPFSFPPKGQFSKLEIKRIPTTPQGALGNMTANQQKMILMVFIIIREIVFNNIFRGWEQHPDQNLDNQQTLLLIQKNSIVLSSIVHDFVVKWIEANVPVQDKINLDELERLFQFNSKPIVVKGKKLSDKAYPENLLIDGMMPSSLIQKYVLNSKGNKEEWLVKLEEDILKFADLLLAQLNKEFEIQKKEEKKEKMGKIILNYLNK